MRQGEVIASRHGVAGTRPPGTVVVLTARSPPSRPRRVGPPAFSGMPMSVLPSRPVSSRTEVRLHAGPPVEQAIPRLEAYLLRDGPLLELSRHPGWLSVLARGLRHHPYCLEAVEGGLTRGF